MRGCFEIFKISYPHFLSMNLIWAPDKQVQIFSNMVSISQRYSNVKEIPWCASQCIHVCVTILCHILIISISVIDISIATTIFVVFITVIGFLPSPLPNRNPSLLTSPFQNLGHFSPLPELPVRFSHFLH